MYTLETDDRIKLAWLLRLRWGAVAGQLALVLGVFFAGVPLPLAPLLSLIAFTATSNAATAILARDESRVLPKWTIGALLALDTLTLTGLLYWSGGPSNPFSALYLVHVTLAAVALGPRWTWALAALASVGFGFLFYENVPIPGTGDPHAHHRATDQPAQGFSMHLQGMWVAFVLTAGLIAYFVGKVTAALSERGGELTQAREMAARNERLASLATLAAGTAHELGTPLATIAVAAKELERELGESQADGELLEDTRLIREEVSRCRKILDQMSADAGQVPGEGRTSHTLAQLVTATLHELGEERQQRVLVQEPLPAATLLVPLTALVRVLASLLRNALEASQKDQGVEFLAELDSGAVVLRVKDQGCGMNEAILPHAGEPFFSTKSTGLGLGLFLARTLTESLGGTLSIDSRAGAGTTVTLRLPREGQSK